MSIAILKNMINKPEAKILHDWAMEQRKSGAMRINCAPQRMFAKWRDLPTVPDLFFDVRRRIATAIGVEDIEEPVLTSYLSVIVSGGAVQHHTDPEPAGYRHLRCNVFVSRPKRGGMPIVEGQRYEIPANAAWWFYPGRMWHTSEVVAGNVPRIVCSYGFLLKDEPGFPDPLKPASPAPA